MISSADVRALATKLCKTSLVLTSTESDLCFKFAEVLKAQQAAKVRELIQSCAEQPLLCSYSSDATPLRTSVRFVHAGSSVDGSHLVRSGKSLQEYLVQRAFYKYIDVHQKQHLAVNISEPVCLGKGKKAWNLYQACEQSLRFLRQDGFRGLSIHHYCFDRGAFSS